MKNIFYYRTVLGKMGIAENGCAITNIFLDDGEPRKKQQGIYEKETELIKTAYGQLDEYLKGERRDFDLPLQPEGTYFQKKVWRVLIEIPYGEVWSYKQAAARAGNEKACRAVGMANNKNPIMIVVPCHRVVGSNGSLTGYAGGLHIKEWLLNLEKRP